MLLKCKHTNTTVTINLLKYNHFHFIALNLTYILNFITKFLSLKILVNFQEIMKLFLHVT